MTDLTEGTDVYLFSSVASYRLHSLMMKQAAKNGRQIVGVYAGAEQNDYKDIESDAAAYGVVVIFFEEEVLNTPHPRFWEECPKPYLLTFFKILSLFACRNPFRSLSLRRNFAQRKKAARMLLLREVASVVVCSEDGVSGDLAMLAVAKELDIPIVDVPYGNATEYDFDVALKQRIAAGQPVVPSGREFWLINCLAKKWLKVRTFPNALLLNPEHVLALESLGITVQNPWIVHGGQSDVLCVENDVSYLQYQREGIQPHKLRKTGTPYCDVLSRVRSDTVRFRQKGSKKLLLSWPPSYHDSFPGVNEFDTYLEMTREVFKFLSALRGVELTVSLHPACSQDVADLLSEMGVDVSKEYILELIGKNDIFSTYFSSTIRWALACGMPVVNYDAYQLKIDTYNSAPGFCNAENFDGYCRILKDLVQNDDLYSELSQAQGAEAELWGVLDGNNTARVLAEVDRVKLGLR